MSYKMRGRLEEQVILETVVVGPLDVNCYLVGDDETRKIFIVDPGDDIVKIQNIIKERALVPIGIINTHAHIDHVGGVKALKDELKIPYYVHSDAVQVLQILPVQAKQFGLFLSGIPKPDRFLAHGDKITVGKSELHVIHTPGHSPGGICIMGDGFLLTGDTLFARSIGRTDLPGGDTDQLMESISKRLLPLDDSLRIYPGHGPSSSLGREKKYNPFLRELESL